MDVMSASLLAAIAAVFLFFVYYRNDPSPIGAPTEPQAPRPDGVPADVWRWKPMVETLHNQLRAPLTPTLWLAMIWQESEGKHEAVGKLQEIGLLQMMQGALDDARNLDNATHLPARTSDLTPAQNVEAGMRYARVNAHRLNGAASQRDLIRMHNGGPDGHTEDATLTYARRVFQRAEKLRG